MSHTVNIHHIVFRTNRSENTIPNTSKNILFKYILTLCQKEGWHLIRINSYLNHVHILIDIPTNAAVSTVVQKIKANSSRALRRNPNFPDFNGWAKKYGSFSVSFSNRNTIIEYIRNQEEHHKTVSFLEEIKRIFGDNGTNVSEFLLDE